MDVIRDIAKLQVDYNKLLKKKCLTKKAMRELIMPFRDKYMLSDIEALSIARNEVSIPKICQILEHQKVDKKI